MKKLLITLGCSWTYGIGVGYRPGMTESDYRKIAWNSELCDQFSFRTILSEKYNHVNKNLSFGGASNQAQFRRAKIFFSSDEFSKLKKQFDQILVLWGITSTARNEFFNLETQKIQNYLYSDSWPFCKAVVKFSYDHDNEVDLLVTEMKHWNTFFHNLQISNLWFDTFNHHEYRFPGHRAKKFQEDYEKFQGPDWPSWEQYRSGTYTTSPEIQEEIADTTRWQFRNEPVQNLIFEDKNPRDLMSLLAIKNGFVDHDNKLHDSSWTIDSNRVRFLVDIGLLNPISKHPTVAGHQSIAEILSEPLSCVLK